MLYHPPSKTVYLAIQCPFPATECRPLTIADLTFATAQVGQTSILISCRPMYRGQLIVLRSGDVRIGVKIPGKLLQAAESLAAKFGGTVVDDPDGTVEETWGKLWSAAAGQEPHS